MLPYSLTNIRNPLSFIIISCYSRNIYPWQYNVEEENGEDSSGQWRQGLYSIEFRVFDKITSPIQPLVTPSPVKITNDLGNGNGSKLTNGLTMNGLNITSRNSLLERKLKTLEQVLIDSDGGMTNELSTMPTTGKYPTTLPHDIFD